MARLYGRTTTKKDFQGLWYDLDLDLLFRWFYHTEGNMWDRWENSASMLRVFSVYCHVEFQELNISLLHDAKVVSDFKVNLKQWLSLKTFFSSVGERWEDVKIRAKKFFIEVGKRKAQKRRLKLHKELFIFT